MMGTTFKEMTSAMSGRAIAMTASHYVATTRSAEDTRGLPTSAISSLEEQILFPVATLILPCSVNFCDWNSFISN